MRNESSNVIRKIDEVFGMQYPKEKLSILIIDSGSSDGTAELAINHLNKKGDEVAWDVITLNSIGKSLAVNHALSLIESNFFVMMDSDAICKPDSLVLLMDWFVDEKIGAVCGKYGAKLENSDFHYRSRFNTTRIGESFIDSTPIFEGSICAFRLKSLSGQLIEGNINADDSQLAMLSRTNGFKAVMDQRVEFFEDSVEISRKRRVRRAQGIIRALYSNRRLLFGERKYSQIIANTMYFHKIFPWTVLASLSLVASTIPQIILFQNFTPIDAIASLLILAIIFLNGTLRSIVKGSLVLVEAQIKILAGIRLEKWNPERD